MADEGRFATYPARVRNRDELEAILARYVDRTDRDELLATLAARGVPAGPILDVAQALSQPAAAALRHAARLPDGRLLQGLRSVAFEPSEVYRPRELRPPPRLGEHTDSVRRELG